MRLRLWRRLRAKLSRLPGLRLHPICLGSSTVSVRLRGDPTGPAKWQIPLYGCPVCKGGVALNWEGGARGTGEMVLRYYCDVCGYTHQQLGKPGRLQEREKLEVM